MAGLTKAQRAAKEAAKEEVKVEEKLPKKYRYEFNSYEEYNNYKGEKG